jgi:uncharacterized membrane protein
MTDSALPASSDGPPATIRARRPTREPIRRLTFRERVSPSLWFTPGLFVVAAFVLSRITVELDRRIQAETAPRWLIGADPAASAALTATVAAAMLTFVAVVFSTTLVAIQLAGGQYSPRVVRVFIRARITHVTLGLFLATFVFALGALVEVHASGPPIVPQVTVSVVYLLLLAALLMFITFLHSMAKMLRVQHLLDRVTKDGRRSFLEEFPPHDDYVSVMAPGSASSVVVRSETKTGVIQAFDRNGLVELARRTDVSIEMLVKAGEYIGHGTPVARVSGSHGAGPSGADIVGLLLLGAERTLLHDPGFALRQLVDIAARALSPAVNDATTAVQVIDRVMDLLGTIATRPDPTGWYMDAENVVRLHLREPGLEQLILLGFVEVIRYGADGPPVVRRLLAAFNVLDGIVREDARGSVDRLRVMLSGAVDAALPAAFTEISMEPDRHGLG